MKRTLIFLLLIIFTASMLFVGISCKAEEAEEAAEEVTEEEEAPAVEEEEEAPATEEAEEEVAEAPSGTMTIGENLIVRTLDPIKPISAQAMSKIKAMYDTLVTYNKDNPADPIPNVCERYEVSDDASEWTFYLRKGVMFTTGNELTADDVVYSFTRGIEGNFPVYPPLGDYLDPATSFEIIDDHTVKMKLIKPYAGFILLLSSAGAAIVDKDTLEQHVTDDDPFGSVWLNDNSIGSGPFMLKEWARDERIVLVANPNYWGIEAGFHRVPSYNELVSLHVPEATTGKFMLDKGDIDMFFEFTRDIIEDYEANAGGDVRIEKSLRFEGTSILMQTDYAPFGDPNVRNAIRYAIDYDTIIDDVFFAVRLDRPFFKPMLGTDDDILYGYDLDMAKDYLAKSAYPDGFDFTLNIGSGVGLSGDWESVSLILQSNMADLGVNMDIEQVDWSVMDEKLFNGEYHAQLNWFGALWADSEAAMSLVARSDSVVLNMNGYENAEVDALADDAVVETDLQERYAIYREISEIFAEDGPNAFIGQGLFSSAWRSDIHGFDGNPSFTEFDFAVLYRE